MSSTQHQVFTWFVVLLLAREIAILCDAIRLTTTQYSTVFMHDTEGYRTFRIPGIAQAADGTFVAFTEGRVPLDRGPYGNASYCYGQLASTADGDCVDKDIVYKISTDRGHSWSKLFILARCNASTFYYNPNLILDSDTSLLWLTYYTCEGHKPDRHCYPLILVSSDHGKTFTVKKSFCSSRGPWFVGGLGGGLQKIGPGPYKGRLLFPDDGRGCVYSDDDGETWKLGSPVPNYGDFLDNQVVELSNGSLLMVLRGSGMNYPFTSRSEDGGNSWSEPTAMMGVRNNDCQVAVASLYGNHGKTAILFMLHPNTRHDLPPPSGRQNLTLSISMDNAAIWTDYLTLTPGPAAYSALVSVGQNQIGCLYEEGHWGVVPIDFSDVRFALVSIDN